MLWSFLSFRVFLIFGIDKIPSYTPLSEVQTHLNICTHISTRTQTHSPTYRSLQILKQLIFFYVVSPLTPSLILFRFRFPQIHHLLSSPLWKMGLDGLLWCTIESQRWVQSFRILSRLAFVYTFYHHFPYSILCLLNISNNLVECLQKTQLNSLLHRDTPISIFSHVTQPHRTIRLCAIMHWLHCNVSYVAGHVRAIEESSHSFARCQAVRAVVRESSHWSTVAGTI